MMFARYDILNCRYFCIMMFAVSLVMDISAEKLDQLLPLLVLVLNKPGCGPLPEELHEAPLHLEPDVARQIEKEGEEGEVEGDPLVV